MIKMTLNKAKLYLVIRQKMILNSYNENDLGRIFGVYKKGV